jgi:hypothetical protein
LWLSGRGGFKTSVNLGTGVGVFTPAPAARLAPALGEAFAALCSPLEADFGCE